MKDEERFKYLELKLKKFDNILNDIVKDINFRKGDIVPILFLREITLKECSILYNKISKGGKNDGTYF